MVRRDDRDHVGRHVTRAVDPGLAVSRPLLVLPWNRRFPDLPEDGEDGAPSALRGNDATSHVVEARPDVVEEVTRYERDVIAGLFRELKEQNLAVTLILQALAECVWMAVGVVADRLSSLSRCCSAQSSVRSYEASCSRSDLWSS